MKLVSSKLINNVFPDCAASARYELVSSSVTAQPRHRSARYSLMSIDARYSLMSSSVTLRHGICTLFIDVFRRDRTATASARYSLVSSSVTAQPRHLHAIHWCLPTWPLSHGICTLFIGVSQRDCSATASACYSLVSSSVTAQPRHLHASHWWTKIPACIYFR